MAQIHWTNAAGGDFNTGSNWAGGKVPGAGDDAIINAATKNGYTVSTSANDTVNSLQTIALTTLQINAGTFTASAGSGTGSNAGAISVGNNTAFVAGGTLANVGKILLNSGGNVTSFVVSAANLTLSGAGSVALTDNGQNFIVGATATATLTNVDNKITGAGTIGNGGMILINQAKGTIDATGSNALVLNALGGTAVNGGLLEGAGTGGLTLRSMTIDNSSGGSLLGVSRIDLQSTTLIGGTLKTIGTGVIDTVDRGSLLDGTTKSVTNQGLLAISNNTSLNIQGTIANTGTIAMNSAGNVTQIVVTAKNATLAGGTVNLTDTTQNFILGTLTGPRGGQSVSTLTNTGVIQGAGNVGANLVLNNTGVIDATLTNTLVIATGNANVAGSNVVTNSGTLESTNPGKLGAVGGLVLSGVTVANNVATGLILANGLHTHVDLQGATIVGGTLNTLSGGVIQTAASDRGSLLDGVASAVNNKGALSITNNASLSIQGAIANTGAITLGSAGNITQLIVTAKNATITGGTVTLSDSTQNFIVGTITGPRGAQTLSKLTNASVISGSGQIGANLLLNNTTTIDATGASSLSLVIGSAAVVGGNTVTNSGLLESTNPGLLTAVGGLILNGVTVDNIRGKGLIEAAGLHTHVDLASATIVGGGLKTASGGVIQTVDRGSVLDGGQQAFGAAFNVGALNVLNNTALTLRGLIGNAGTIALGSVGNVTDLIIGNNTVFPSRNNVILASGGAITMSDNSQNRIYGASAGSSLTNTNNTISGAGQLGAGGLILINQAKGVINAIGNNALIVNVGATAVANSGLMEGSGAGGLTIQSSTIDNSTGGVMTANNGSFVNLQSANIIGGTLTVAGTGAFQTVDTGSLLNGQKSTVNNQGLINILNNTALTVQGNLNNTGTVMMNSIGNFTDFIVDATGVTLTGKGTFTLSSNAQNRIYGATSASTLTNVDNIIAGGGQIGVTGAGAGLGGLTLVNGVAGVINANSATGLVISVGAAAVTNSGLIEATGAGGLTVLASTINDSTGGTILAGNGSFVSLQNADIIGGSLKSAGTGVFQTTDMLSLFNGQTKAVTTSGTVNILNNTALTLQGSIVNTKTGTIALNSGGNFTDLIVDTTGATLSGGGNVTLSNTGNNRIYGATSASVLTNVDNTISGGGQIGVTGAGSGPGGLTLINQTKGVIDGTTPTVLTLDTGANTITNAGLIEADSGGATTINSAVANTGVLEANGGTLVLNGVVTGTGKGLITAGTLEITNANAAENVTFTGSTGTLLLIHSQSYTGKVTGFTKTTGTAFDLRDISFNGSTTASYSGNAAGGVLTVTTVTTGTQVATITLVGNYLSSNFIVGNDGAGGTIVQDPPKAPGAHAPPPATLAATASPHPLVAAMAGLGAGAAGVSHVTADPWRAPAALLTAPRVHIA